MRIAPKTVKANRGQTWWNHFYRPGPSTPDGMWFVETGYNAVAVRVVWDARTPIVRPDQFYQRLETAKHGVLYDAQDAVLTQLSVASPTVTKRPPKPAPAFDMGTTSLPDDKDPAEERRTATALLTLRVLQKLGTLPTPPVDESGAAR